MSTDYTKIATADAPDFAAGRMEGVEARGLRDPAGAEQTGAMLHKLQPGVRQGFGHVHHEAEELFFVLSGSGRVNVGDEVVELAERDLIRLAPTTPRCFEAGDDGLEFLAFGPHLKGDGRILPGWWGGDVPPED
ncbi:MAG: cupin domain-containing protein [Baekduia sp.]